MSGVHEETPDCKLPNINAKLIGKQDRFFELASVHKGLLDY